MSGIGVLYTLFAVILTCFLGGFTFFAFLGIGQLENVSAIDGL
jgi:UPF0716 family protein affecting phage T7 exclusion